MNTDNAQEKANAVDERLSQVLAKSATDEEFRAKLLANPREVLISEGVDIADGVDIDLQETSDTRMVVVLPPLPNESDFSN